jgi:aminomethyltransferase
MDKNNRARPFGGAMSGSSDHVEFVVKAVGNTGGASEFRQSMLPHPLVYQELPHDPQFGIYNGRLRALSYTHGDMEALYWRLRRQVMLSHTGELATEIVGPDAVFPTPVSLPQRSLALMRSLCSSASSRVA